LGSSFSLGPGSTFLNSGGIINIQGTVDNTGRVLTFDEKWSVVYLDHGGKIVGGTVNTAGNELLVSLSGALDGVTLTGTVKLPEGASARLIVTNGLMLDNGVIKVTNAGIVSFSANQTLT